MENQYFLKTYKFTENTEKYIDDNQDFKQQLEEFNKSKKINKELLQKIDQIQEKSIKTEVIAYTAFKTLEGCFNLEENKVNQEQLKEKQEDLNNIFKLNNADENEGNNDLLANIEQFFDKFCKNNSIENEGNNDLLANIKQFFDKFCKDNSIENEDDVLKFINNELTGAGFDEIDSNIFNIGGTGLQDNFASIGQNENIDDIDEKENKDKKNEEDKDKTEDKEDKEDKEKKKKDKNKSRSIPSKSKSFNADKESANITEALKTCSYFGLGGICLAIGAVCPIFYLFAMFYFATATMGPDKMGEYLNSKNPIIKCLARISAAPNILLSSAKKILVPGSGKAKDGFSMLGNFLTGENINIDYNKNGYTKKVADKIVGKNEKKNNNHTDMLNQMINDNGNQSKKEELDKQIAKVHEEVSDGHISEQDMENVNELLKDENLENMTPEQLQQAEKDIETCTETLEKQVQSDNSFAGITTPGESEPLQGLENEQMKKIIQNHKDKEGMNKEEQLQYQTQNDTNNYKNLN